MNLHTSYARNQGSKRIKKRRRRSLCRLSPPGSPFSGAPDSNQLSPGAPASRPPASRPPDPCPLSPCALPLESRLSVPSSSRPQKPLTPALSSVRNSPATRSPTATRERPLPIRRVRETALDFWGEKDESVTAEEFICMHEPVVFTPCEKATSILYDSLYRRHARLQAAAADPVAADLVATLLSEIVGEPGTCVTYPDTKPARIEEEDEEVKEEAEKMVAVVNVDVTPRSVPARAKGKSGQEKAKKRRKRLGLGLRCRYRDV